MTGRIFRSILFCTLTVLLICFFGMLAILYLSIQDMARQELIIQTRLVQQMTELQKQDLAQISLNGYRISLFSADGHLLYDSSGLVSSQDHSDREEIRMAMETGTGQSIRWSDSLEQQTLYEALKLSDGRILRLSVDYTSLPGLFLHYLQPATLLIFAAVLLSFFLARKLAADIMDPVNAIDLEHPMQNQIYPQLKPLLEKLEENQNQIRSQAREFETVADNMEESLLMLSKDGIILSQNSTARHLFSQQTGAQISHPILIKLFTDQQPCTFCHNQHTLLARLSRVDKDKGGSAILVLDITDKMEAARRRQEFTDNVTHELKTPLQTILSSAELLQSGIVKPEDNERFVQFILLEGNRMKEMIESILHLSNLDRNLSPKKGWIVLQPFLDKIIARTPNPLNVSIHCDLSVDRLFSDAVALEDILSNLISNGLKYNRPDGTLYIKINAEKIIVKDTGIGIEKKDESRIFERFYRADQSRNSQIPGTGLGLAIVKHQVELLQGTIHLKTGKDGTTITIFFKEPTSMLSRPQYDLQ